jgi:hypothetical protein
MQVIDYNDAPLIGWFIEDCSLLQYTDTQPRLSGGRLRSHLYFATTPRDYNTALHVSRTKTGLTGLLPGVR